MLHLLGEMGDRSILLSFDEVRFGDGPGGWMIYVIQR